MYTLYYAPGSAAMAPHVVLEEIGAPHKMVRVDTKAGDHRKPEYLKLNPHGRIPTFVDGDFVMFESAAIMMHLADKHPEARLAPAVGSAARGHYYQWVCYLTNTVQDAFINYYHEDYFAESAAAQKEVKAVAERRLATMWEKVDAALAGGPYLLGAEFSAPDIFLAMLARWSRGCAKPGYTYANIGRCCDLVRKRPAFQRTLEAEGISWPVA